MSTARAFQGGMVVFIGAGPGDPELLTLRGKRVIEAADLVIYADSLVHPGIGAFARPDADVLGSAALSLEEISQRMIVAAQAGLLVARVQSGDPSIYGAMHEQMVRLDAAGVAYAVVPGVSSAFAAAAALDAELTVPDVAQTVIFTRLPSRTTIPERERLREMAQHGGTVVLFLSIQVIERAVSELIAGGYPEHTPAAVLHRVTWEDETILRGTLADIAAQVRQARLTRQAIVLVGRAIDPDLRQAAAASRSNLYDPAYSHVFRLAQGRGRSTHTSATPADANP
ncbi:MAG: precorrin-4 C(11)-methyltransferase [Chloroflexi bacterium]|nr:precorrin-4 C(11)-methyltransferase [Chloroflexota bacterium]